LYFVISARFKTLKQSRRLSNVTICLSLRTGIVELFLQISFAIFFLLQNFIDLLLQLLAIIANRTSRSKSPGLRVTSRRLVDCRLLRILRLIPITTS
jgi:hypothetical protein